MEIKAGDRVRFRAGRGHAEGRVVNVAEYTVTISTRGEKCLNRKKSQVVRVEQPATPATDAEAK